jgi:hypothetical protein
LVVVVVGGWGGSAWGAGVQCQCAA